MMKEAEETSDFDYSKLFVLDTGAAFHSVMSESLLTRTYESNEQLEMCTNTGTRTLT